VPPTWSTRVFTSRPPVHRRPCRAAQQGLHPDLLRRGSFDPKAGRVHATADAQQQRPGQAVYEPFLGSGTTLIAAQSTGRVCYGVEIDPLFVDVAIRRWQAYCEGIIYFDAEISDRAFDLGMSEQKLDGP
jgi:tRNA G10  N-methylase Trm11